jgi:tetratricopeptide (TPR) repeat protein
VNALDSRAFVHLRAHRLDQAVADYDASLKIEPNKASSLYGRGMAKRRKGAFEEGNADIAAARAAKPDITAEFTRYGLSPPLIDLKPQAQAAPPEPMARQQPQTQAQPLPRPVAR